MDISKKLRTRRKELDLTLLEIAQKVGVSEATVSRWESGDIANMRRDKIVALANALQVSPSFIMDYDDSDLSQKTISRYYRSIIAENLKKFRQDKNLNMFEAAEKIGISQRVYANIESGSCNAALDTLILMANGLDVSLDDLIGRDAKNYSNITNEEKTLLNKYHMLSLSGKDRANGYIDDLLKVSEYREDESNFNERTVLVYDNIRKVAEGENSTPPLNIKSKKSTRT